MDSRDDQIIHKFIKYFISFTPIVFYICSTKF